MKTFTVLFFALSITQATIFPANAEVLATFTDNKAILNIQGNDGDFEHMYEALTADEREVSGTLRKNFELKSSTDEIIFKIDCNRLPNSFDGSCLLEFNQWASIPAEITIDKERGMALLESKDKWSAQELAKNFISPAELGGIYFSADGKLSIQAQQDHFGKITKLMISFLLKTDRKQLDCGSY